jgi:hypothetical protein
MGDKLDGGIGKALDIVEKVLADPSDPQNEEALRGLAQRLDKQEKALLILHERLRKLEAA